MSGLSPRIKSDFVDAWNTLIDELGTPFNHKRSDNGFEETIFGHMTALTGEEQPMINELGLEARTIRTKSSAAITKHDTMAAPSGKTYTVHAVHEVYVNEVHVGFAVYVK